jgi:hypothetical protein
VSAVRDATQPGQGRRVPTPLPIAEAVRVVRETRRVKVKEVAAMLYVRSMIHGMLQFHTVRKVDAYSPFAETRQLA